MDIDITDIRRLFRNRLEVYLEEGYEADGSQLDGSPLTLLECSDLLIGDLEPFPFGFRENLRRLRIQARLGRPIARHTYADVASLFLNVLLKKSHSQIAASNRNVSAAAQ